MLKIVKKNLGGITKKMFRELLTPCLRKNLGKTKNKLKKILGTFENLGMATGE